tara:strand:+ start:2415 stop:2858 length:444 start_codon:yes stop_codon:yes gene_type:complete
VIEISISNDYNESLSYNSKFIVNLSTKVLSLENFHFAQISIILSNKEFVSKLKKQYFNVDVFTDVITFDLEEDGNKIDGEVYISIDDVIDNAKIYKKSFDDEFKRVLVHGLLHLIGYNDDTVKQKEDMRILEDKYILLIKEEIISIS